MNGPTKRDRLVDSAAELFHKQGIVSTSLADIAKHADIPIGNVYYYFKTKDELALAAIEKRRRSMSDVFAKLDAMLDDSRQRLIEMVRIFEQVKDEYTRYGCPVYRMIIDGGETDKDTVARAASQIYEDFVAWAENQFNNLGHEELSRGYAVSLLAGIQGGALMAKSLRQPQIMADELQRLITWLSEMPNKKIFLGKAGLMRAGAPA
jgi:TetR/AcrR family transcriptional regulator, transcriptional repressor for nem operon